ncbi:MAG: UDP-N-acetylmuramoyl-tripeptide--D-alanyl-D-alanine ligase, partial [Clostridia bacterium]|nr:UDP-N-acetylmuramoyl-tripeptide--D-alanyl-D-alanine ligase [Clostridia bacterium]
MRLAYLLDIVTSAIFGGIYVGCYFLQSSAFWGFLAVTFFFISEIVLYFMEEIPDKKKPMRYTKRLVRGYVAVVIVVSSVFTVLLTRINFLIAGSYWRYSIFFGYTITFPLLFIVVMFVVNIFEKLNNYRYERRTKNTLYSSSVKKIAITGSFGKTSVKNCLNIILSTKYRVLATPESYNTPMGIAKTVNTLDGSYDIFLAEMGARRKGDIKKLMKIINPDITVLTGINEQHLKTFKTFENIKAEKLKAVTMLRPDGFSVVSDKIKDYVEEIENKKNVRYSIIYSGISPECDVYANEIGLTDYGCVFNLYFDGVPYVAKTKLLGKHNVENIALASAVAYEIGLTPDEIVAGIAKIQPVEHRLHLIHSDGIKIIDDTFNSNPDGARIALETLSLFDGRKIVVTPGLVELGSRESEENRILGEEIAIYCDIAILIGKRA